MGFGAGKFRRTKWISFWWAGTAVGVAKRGAYLASKERAMGVRACVCRDPQKKNCLMVHKYVTVVAVY